MPRRQRNPGGNILGWIVFLAIAALMFWTLHQKQKQGSAPSNTGNVQVSAESPQLALGNPSNATADPSNKDNFLMLKPYFALSYNNSKGIPNWVSWRVTAKDLGDAPRKPIFDTDLTLPAGFKRVTHKDYSASGFDRGHLCPHSDRAANEEMSFATFVMTNIIPQAPHVNEQAWAYLEEYSRQLAKSGNTLYIVAGPSGQGGKGSNGFATDLKGGKVVVPAECWKVIVVGDTSGNVSPNSTVIAVLMPNDNDKVGQDWKKFRVSVAQIESETGFKFFSALPSDVADALRKKGT